MRNAKILHELRRRAQTLSAEVEMALQVKPNGWSGFESATHHSIMAGFSLITTGLLRFEADARGSQEPLQAVQVPTTLTCERCGHSWVPRRPKQTTCPTCKSPYWNIPKKQPTVDTAG